MLMALCPSSEMGFPLWIIITLPTRQKRAAEVLEREPDISARKLSTVLHMRWEKADKPIRAYRRNEGNLAL
jgi:hypothetical protein